MLLTNRHIQSIEFLTQSRNVGHWTQLESVHIHLPCCTWSHHSTCCIPMHLCQTCMLETLDFPFLLAIVHYFKTMHLHLHFHVLGHSLLHKYLAALIFTACTFLAVFYLPMLYCTFMSLTNTCFLELFLW
jgi:hypothetical protein